MAIVNIYHYSINVINKATNISVISLKDLKEYLYQLLGHENATIANFIERLWNSKLGYHTDTKTVVSSSVERESNPLPCRSLEDMNRNDNEKIEINLLRNLNQSKDHRLPKSDNGSGSFIQENIQIKPNQQQNQQQQQQQQAKEQWKSDQEALKRGHQESLNRLKDKHNKKVDEPTHPVRKGKPENPCGCYGIRHRPLINCLFCGRIACELEGYNDCNFCGNPLVESDKYRQEKFKQDNVAWKQKELMVQYDREYARRTVVYDEQADYYSNSTSSWLTGKEREEESKKDESNRRVLHDRDLVMNLGI